MTNKLKIFSNLLLSGLLIYSSGCNKVEDFGSTNVNPNGTPVPITAALLTNVESQLAGFSVNVRNGYYCQYFSETQYPAASLYSIPQLDFTGIYAGALEDLQNIINQNTDAATKAVVVASGSNANQIAVAKILKSYLLWTITDRWGDVPYSKALTGDPHPVYDAQADIYKGLIADLKAAVAGFDGGAAFKGDILLGGDNSKWKKFGNSLRMMIALRTSKVYPAPGGWAATEFASALADAGGSLSSNSDNVILKFPGAAYQNPWYNEYVATSRKDDAESSTMTSTLTTLNDPRIDVFGDSHNGFPYGLSRDQATLISSWAYVFEGTSIADNEPSIVLNAATILFARSEAAELGWTSESASTLYKQAVTTSLQQWGATAGQITSYLAQAAVDYGASSHLSKIGTQRWIALYPDGTQGWAEWRRTGFPALTPSAYAVNSSKQIPRRYVYGTNEYALNNDAVKTAAAALTGGDSQDAKMWWDK
jgi:Starch-binding associating with outer membrane